MEILLFSSALQLALFVAAPTAACVILAGLVGGVLQTVTQVSDESISLGLRVAAAAAALLFFSHFMFSELQTFAVYAWGGGSQP